MFDIFKARRISRQERYHVEYNFYGNNRCLFFIYKVVVAGQYRGEDSGAIYSEYESQLVERYDISKLLDIIIDLEKKKTLRDLLNYRDYFGNRLQPEKLYSILCKIHNIDDYKY